MAKINKRRRKLIVQLVEYMVSGGVYFWVGYVTFALFYGFHTDKFTFEGLGWNLWWSTITSNVIGWTVNFLLQASTDFNTWSTPSSPGNRAKLGASISWYR